MKTRKGQLELSEGIGIILIVGLVFLLMATFAFLNQEYSNSISEETTAQATESDSNIIISPYTINNTPLAGSFSANTTNQTWLKFDGINDIVTANYLNGINETEDFSVSLWVKMDSITPATQFVFSNIAPGDQEFILLYQNTSEYRFFNSLGNASGSVDADKYVTESMAWVNIVSAYNKTDKELYLYFNGLIGTDSGGHIGSTTERIAIGAKSNSVSFLNGTVDEVRVYDSFLTLADAIIINNTGRHRNLTVFGNSKDDDMIFYSSFNENTGTTAYDSIGGNNGTIDGATYQNDGVFVDLAEDTDYSITGDALTVLSERWDYSQWNFNYSYDYQTGRVFTANTVLQDANTNIADNTSIAGMLMTITLIGIVLTALIGIFLTVRPRRV